MPFALTAVGLLLVITGFQNTYRQFGKMVQGDFSGANSFIYWMAAVAVVGGLGYIKGLESFSRAFMVLILTALVIAMYKQNPNVFSNITTGLSSGSTESVNPIGAPLAGSSGGGGSSDSSGSGLLSDIGGLSSDFDIASSVFGGL